LKPRSQNGEAHHCADGVNQVLYPGILIESQDAEEAAYFCGCRATLANHPCPKCLVAKTDLHKISGNYELRTPQSMQSVLTRVSNAKTKTAKEKILKDNGMHNIEVSVRNMDLNYPYQLRHYSTSSGNFDFLTPTEPIHMIPCTQTTWENGANTCGC